MFVDVSAPPPAPAQTAPAAHRRSLSSRPPSCVPAQEQLAMRATAFLRVAWLSVCRAKLKKLRGKRKPPVPSEPAAPLAYVLHTPALRLERCAPLKTIAPELLVHILAYLSAGDLLRFSETSKEHHALVQGSSLLQYRLELAATGMEDGPPTRRPINERLKMLRAQQTAWQSFGYRHRLEIPMGPGALRPCYDLHGGLFFVGRRAGGLMPINTLSWIELPAMEPGTPPPVEPPPWQSAALPVDIDDFALDLQQDLLALVEVLVPNAERLHVHLLSFSDTAPHPLAALPVLAMDCHRVNSHSSVVIDICGCHVGLLFNADYGSFNNSDAVTIWNWKDGTARCVVSAGHIRLTSFVFLQEDTFLLPDIGDRALEVYTLDRATGAFVRERSFLLPAQAEGTVLFNASSRYRSRGLYAPPAGARAPPGARPCFLSLEQELVIVSLDYRTQEGTHHYHLVTRKAALLARPWTAGSRVPWHVWGPRNSRLLAEPPRMWDYFFSGSRLVALDNGRVRVLDFNAAALARRGAGEPPQPTRTVRAVRAPGVVPAGPIFAVDVRSALPYLETVTSASFGLANVMCDHERVIGLNTKNVVDMESLDVFLL